VRFLLAVAIGVIFAVGLALAGMTDPAKITGVLDVGGRWDPSLLFVMAGAIGVFAPISRIARRQRAPRLDRRFHWPVEHGIDIWLVGGAALFGIGWGISGYCPAPALASMVAGGAPVLVFVATMLIGIAAGRAISRRRRPRDPQGTATEP
jgi:uncharacterized membrane protein YedE/YeeE